MRANASGVGLGRGFAPTVAAPPPGGCLPLPPTDRPSDESSPDEATNNLPVPVVTEGGSSHRQPVELLDHMLNRGHTSCDEPIEAISRPQ